MKLSCGSLSRAGWGVPRLPALLPALLLAGLPSCGDNGVAPANPDNSGDGAPVESRVTVPPGFRVTVWAANVPNARSLALSPEGVLYVGTRSAGRVYAIVDRDHNRQADSVYVIAEGLDEPNGVAWRDGDLYVAEISRVIRFPGIDQRLADPPAPVTVSDRFPSDRSHGWKFIRFGPDGLLYVPVGAPCNICLPEDPRFVTIMRMQPDGSGFEIFASGRAQHASASTGTRPTRVLWFTDNGRDWLGDDLPPDELNRAPARDAFRLPLLPRRRHPGPGVREAARRARVCPAGDQARRRTWPSLGMRFYTGGDVPGRVPRRRSSSPSTARWNREHPDRLPADAGAARRRCARRATRCSPRVGCRAGRPGGGRWTSGACRTAALLVSDDHGRGRLPDQLRGGVERSRDKAMMRSDIFHSVREPFSQVMVPKRLTPIYSLW